MSVKNAPSVPAAEPLWLVSIEMRTKRTPFAAVASGSVVSCPLSPGANVCVTAGVNVTPSGETSMRNVLVAAVASSPHVAAGSTANPVTFTVAARRTVALGGAP